MSSAVSFDPRTPVAVVPCDAYEPTVLRREIPVIMETLGITPAFFAGKRVAVKPNLVMKKPAEYAATTHPAVLDALLSYLDGCACADVVIAESMGGPYTEAALRGVYAACGIADAVSGHRARLNTDVSSRPMSAPDGAICKSFDIITPIADADVIINLCKLKSHSLTRMSGAIKNTFGCIPGLTKFEFHARFSDYADFNRMLVDLSEMLHTQKACIDLCDAIVGMEGNGPTGGIPRKLGCLLASRNPFCLDTVASAILACEGEVPMIGEAVLRGYAPAHADAVNITDDYRPLIAADFRAPDTAQRSRNALHWLPKVFGGKLFEWFSPRPVIRTSTCVGCGECERSCPVHTIEMIRDKQGKKKAKIHPDKCIRCFCCQELCPIHSVDIRKNGLLNLLAGLRH
ncbi:MAG: DUF362 domain-containing protein [Clostridia bacterium]|nr:DUF362 domain-containing protein [Clostridia bacterium]